MNKQSMSGEKRCRCIKAGEITSRWRSSMRCWLFVLYKAEDGGILSEELKRDPALLERAEQEIRAVEKMGDGARVNRFLDSLYE